MQINRISNPNFKGLFDPTVLVTGGSGYVGSHLLDKLSRDSDYNFVILCRNKDKQAYLDNMMQNNIRNKTNKNLYSFYQTDLSQVKEVEELFNNGNTYDAVVHLGGVTYNSESLVNPRKYYENNFIASRNLVNGMLDKAVKKLMFFSTSSTYMPQDSIPIKETVMQNPKTPYAKTKYMIEQMISDYKVYGLEPVTTRMFNVAGANKVNDLDVGNNVITTLLKKIKNNDIFTLMGSNYNTPDGTCVRDFIHVDDVCEASSGLLNKMFEEPVKDVFNLGSGVGTSLGEIIKSAQEITGKEVQLKITPKLELEPPFIVSNIEKVKGLINWAPQKNINDIISSLWKYISVKK